ncbi:hypothetical protein CPB85DRAFT_72247 [Mucidula mucida]|nr:hypothetical protein CPB85DRAFT_72247 [Mucidula mucida]
MLSIVLPSHHVGGAVHMMHDGATITFNTEDQSAASITAIAAYNAVSQRLDPIHSGYVVCLCYELRFLGRQESIPRLPDLAGARLQLLCVFRSWRQWLDFGAEDVDEDSDFDDDETPDCVACLCERTYDDGTAKFKATSLRGSDRLMLEHIAPLAKTYGFDLHLAHVTYKQSGIASFNSVRRRKWGGCECGGCSEDMVSSCDEDAADWSDVNVNKLEMTEDVESINLDLSILALDGMPMQMSGATVEAMKRQDGNMDNGYSGYFINGSLEHGDRKPSLKRERRTWGTLTYSYIRTALIITPEASPTVNFALGDVREFACMALESSSSETPTTKEQRLVEALLAWSTKNQTLQVAKAASVLAMKEVTKVLRDSAERWNSTDLFVKTLESCGLGRCMMTVGVNGLLSGYRAFDWDTLRAVFSEILSKTMSITLCAQLVDGVRLIAVDSLTQTFFPGARHRKNWLWTR